MKKKDVQSCIKTGLKLYKELRLQVNHCLYTFIESEFTKWKKVIKINSGIISKLCADLQTMAKTCAKFHKDRYKIVWGVALTRYPLSLDFHIIWGQKMTKFAKQKITQGLYPNHMLIFRPWKKYVQSFKKIGIKLYEELRSQGTHCLYIEVEKWLSSQSEKSEKISNNYIQTTCTSSHHEENISIVSKRSVKNCKRSCAHKTPMVNVDGRTDERTDGRTDEQTDGNLHIHKAMLPLLPKKKKKKRD